MFTFDESEPLRVETTITLSCGSFVLFLSPPTVEERLIDDSLAFTMFRADGEQAANAYRTRYLKRLARVIGWDGINDSVGRPVAFSILALTRLMAKHPAAIGVIDTELAKLFRAEEQNLGEHPASQNGSPTTPTSTAPAFPVLHVPSGQVSPS